MPLVATVVRSVSLKPSTCEYSSGNPTRCNSAADVFAHVVERANKAALEDFERGFYGVGGDVAANLLLVPWLTDSGLLKCTEKVLYAWASSVIRRAQASI